MWEPYKLAIESALPHVYIVIDAFHLIQASTKALDGVRKTVQTKLNKEQALAMKLDSEKFSNFKKPENQCQNQVHPAWSG